MVGDTEQKERKPLNTPKIFIDVNPQEEVEEFYWAFHNQRWPWMRENTLNLDGFQPLKDSLESSKTLDEEQEKQVIGSFLKNYREQHQDNIQAYLNRSQQELEKKSDNALIELAQLMDYEWPEDFPGYRVVPVLLPFSPFGENTFFFSISGAARGKEQMTMLDVAIHEISHMVLYKVMEKTHPDLVIHQEPVDTCVEDLKEILAPVLMNQPPLRKFLDLSIHPEGYMGNDYLEGMYVQEEDAEEKVQISKYFQDIYKRMKYEENKTFPEILDEMIRVIQPLEKEIGKRNELWNKHSWKIFTDEKISKAYSEPIKITKAII